MQIKSIRYLRRKLNFKKEFIFTPDQKNHQEFFIVILETSDNFVGLGEAVLLPSHGTENEKTFLNEIENLSRNIYQYSINSDFYSNEPFFNQLNFTPALRNAIEQAVLNILIQSTKTTVAEILNTTISESTPVNFMLPSTEPEFIVPILTENIEDGFDTVKLKCTAENIETEINHINQIAQKFSSIKFRIDPNCKWDTNNIDYINKNLIRTNVEYTEQPVRELESLVKFNKYLKTNIAADESASGIDEITKLIESGIKKIILKPMAAGGLINSLKILKIAKDKKIKVIISSSMESNIGLQFPIILSLINDSKYADGLSTFMLFESNLIPDWFEIKKGILTVKNVNNHMSKIYDYN